MGTTYLFKNTHSASEGVKHSSPQFCEYEPKLEADKRLEMQNRFIDKELRKKALFKRLNILKAFKNTVVGVFVLRNSWSHPFFINRNLVEVSRGRSFS